MDLSSHAILLILAIGGMVILGVILQVILKELFEDARKVSRNNSNVIRSSQIQVQAPKFTPTRKNPSRQQRPAKKIVICPDCSVPIELGKLQRHRAKVHQTVCRCALCNQYIRLDNLAEHNLKQHGNPATDILRPKPIPCPHCHNSVLQKNLRKHLSNIHQFNFNTSLGRHPFLTAIEYERKRFWIIDGLNIVRMRGQDLPRLDFLLALTYRMLEEGTDFLCIFDASAPPAIRDFQGTAYAKFYDHLTQSHPRQFSQVPSGTIADEFILDIAKMFGQNVITNDQYRDHFERHSWLETESEQRLFGVELKYSPKLHREVLFWNSQKIPVPSRHIIRKFFKNYNDLLKERDADRLQGVKSIRRSS
ncbi:MAG: hypothetical protein IT426_21355 [Pirellulales bacterium]|nr:hypothetical protein [Pirellulales bacterium]